MSRHLIQDLLLLAILIWALGFWLTLGVLLLVAVIRVAE